MNKLLSLIAFLALSTRAELQPNHGALCNEFTGSVGFNFNSNTDCINAAGCSPVRTSTIVCTSAAKDEKKLCDTAVVVYNAAYASGSSSATKCETKDGKTTVVVTTKFNGAITCKETTNADIKADLVKFITSVACSGGGNGNGTGTGTGGNGNGTGTGTGGNGSGSGGSGTGGAGSGTGGAGSGTGGAGSGNGGSGNGSGNNAGTGSNSNSTLNDRVAKDKSNDATSLTIGSFAVALFAVIFH